MSTTREQDEKAEQVAAAHGRSLVLPLDGAPDTVVVVGLRDEDRVAAILVVPPHGFGRPATAAERPAILTAADYALGA